MEEGVGEIGFGCWSSVRGGEGGAMIPVQVLMMNVMADGPG